MGRGMNIEIVPDDQDDILFDLDRQRSGAISQAEMFERQAEELQHRARRKRQQAARLEQIADYVRTLKSQLKD